jgi:hypothetical protein
VCSQCGKGWCTECILHHGNATICPDCDALCVKTADNEEAERVARQRRRPLRDELGTVFSYPLRDPMAYIMMAVFVGFASIGAKVGGLPGLIAIIFYYGLLYGYAFTAINRVSAGNTTNFMPEISDFSGLLKPVFLGLAAMIISRGPMFALLFVLGVSSIFALMSNGMRAEEPTYEATPMPEELKAFLESEGMSEEEIAGMREGYGAMESVPSTPALGPIVGAVIGLPFALLWWLLYTPIALIAAGISQSFFATLNPLTGIDAIRRMGSIYWEAWLVYTGIAIVGGLGAVTLGLVPFLGSFLAAFVEAYMYLCFGCLLGFAVFKRAEELGVD